MLYNTSFYKVTICTTSLHSSIIYQYITYVYTYTDVLAQTDNPRQADAAMDAVRPDAMRADNDSRTFPDRRPQGPTVKRNRMHVVVSEFG